MRAISINAAGRALPVQSGEGDWIQPPGGEPFDIRAVLRILKQLDCRGPVALQRFGIPGVARGHLTRSIAAWRKLAGRAGI
ncbi:MAG: hypothetical protein C0504_07545 [Candidatus Solibacter sp.]|nr:hypothetical protein [Candidatus Solibacter sp.]